ncbi:hypothetical protein YDYSY3_23280 [Paenibacillus chitinolyticus]|uniref:helix-turn-helix domain-containing protein n=1 Tax=Paenibacillus chitinolyticus TaxID=79263 RepID=UPI0026E4CF06|nr:helix-turn-helix transcriptional regulator [Paenibacillus chitinolyticus]GKS11328.1 hypothetical protein YDYSY3_23280 [Paenibacillus chitinolyticus]
MTVEQTIGIIIRDMRKNLGITQEETAEILETLPSYVGAVERGEKNLTIRTVQRFAHAFDVDVFEMLSLKTEQNETITAINLYLLPQSEKKQKKMLSLIQLFCEPDE